MSKAHWENVYQTKQTNKVSWYQAKDDTTMAFIRAQHIALDQQIIDVGSGASVLIDQLLEAGYQNLYVLDLSETALETTKQRLQQKGLDASHVIWLVQDVCTANLPKHQFDMWHDRAVFHFMVSNEQKQQYLTVLKNALKAGGRLILSTFAEDGPTHCSGLPVQRYHITTLQNLLGSDFQLVSHLIDTHLTPWQSEQKFLNSVWIKH